MVTWITRSSSPIKSIATSRAPERLARISVCPEWGTPAAASASLLTGAVTIPSTAPSFARSTAVSMYW